MALFPTNLPVLFAASISSSYITEFYNKPLEERLAFFLQQEIRQMDMMIDALDKVLYAPVAGRYTKK
jgi:hypothetical protein